MKKEDKLLYQIRLAIRRKHYSRSTEKSYVSWAYRFIVFHKKVHPQYLGEKEVVDYLNHLASVRNVAASTQNQAMCAILFLYRDVIKQDLPWLQNLEFSQRPKTLPTVLSEKEGNRESGIGNRESGIGNREFVTRNNQVKPLLQIPDS